jgi:hypothetical protein
MSLCGATHEAPGQLGVRTFRGPGDDVGGGFDGGPALDAQEEGPPPLGVTPDPKGALRAEARPMGIFDAVCRGVRTCHQRDGRARASLGLITRNKSVQAQSRRVGRTCKQPCNGSRGEAPKKCSTFSERSQHVLWDLWSTLIVTPDFSSDLERGAVPRSIADEKSGVTVLVIELHWSQDSEHFRSPAVFLGILPRAA